MADPSDPVPATLSRPARTPDVMAPGRTQDHALALETHTFGRFRDLLEAVTLSSAMGAYLSMRGSQKADPATGRQPDEMNFMQTAIGSSTGFLGSDLRPDYASLLPLADDPKGLVDALNLTLAAGRLGDAAQRTIRDAVTAMTTGTDSNRLQRVRAAVFLTMACPDYMVLK